MKKKKAVKRARRVVKVVGSAATATVAGRGAAENGDGVSEVGVVPCPVLRDPAMGDKTPEVMAWYREYQPEEFKRRYGNRVCPEVGELVVGDGVRGSVCDGEGDEGGPVSDFEDEDDEVVVVKPRVIMG